MRSMNVPESLRTWFVVHFVVDYLFALPLFFAPRFTLTWLGFESIDPFATRIVAAALFAIGGVSFVIRDGRIAVFDVMLTLKLVWSVAAIVGMAVTMVEGGPAFGYVAIAVFTLFSVVWAYYKIMFVQNA